MDLMKNIIKKAKESRNLIVLPESDDIRILKATEKIVKNKIADIVLIGEIKEIKKLSKENNINLKDVKIISVNQKDLSEKYANKLYDLRKHKGLKLKEAQELLLDPIYFATMMVYFGDAMGLVSGAAHSTASTLKPAFQIIKVKPGYSLVSSFFFMIKNKKTYLFSDCGVNINPDSSQLADIAIATAKSAKEFGIKPKVAMLSFSTKGSANHPLVDKVVEATKIVQAKNPELLIDGELQLDAAIIPHVAEKKAPNSPVAGRANVFIFPDLNSGNIGYKLVERIAGATAIGPIIQGLKKPVNDLSRGCSVDDIVKVVAITSVQSKE